MAANHDSRIGYAMAAQLWAYVRRMPAALPSAVLPAEVTLAAHDLEHLYEASNKMTLTEMYNAAMEAEREDGGVQLHPEGFGYLLAKAAVSAAMLPAPWPIAPPIFTIELDAGDPLTAELRWEGEETGPLKPGGRTRVRRRKNPTEEDILEHDLGVDNPAGGKMRVQSLLFPVTRYSAERAKAWAEKHGYKFGKVDTTDHYHRLRQFDPPRGGTCRTIDLDRKHGVRAVVCK